MRDIVYVSNELYAHVETIEYDLCNRLYIPEQLPYVFERIKKPQTRLRFLFIQSKYYSASTAFILKRILPCLSISRTFTRTTSPCESLSETFSTRSSQICEI